MPPVLFAWPVEKKSSSSHTLFRLTIRSETGGATTESIAADTTESSQTTLLGISIIAFVSGLIVLAVAIWFVIRFFRRRAQEERIANRGAAFLSVRGLVKESDTTVEKGEKGLPALPTTQVDLEHPESPSHPHLHPPPSDVTIPQRAHIPSTASLEDIMKYYRGSGPLPRPFGMIPGGLRPAGSPLSTMVFRVSGVTPSPRSSFTSFAGQQMAMHRETPPESPMAFDRPSPSSRNSSPMQMQGETRKVCQVFTAVLPDELRLNRFGELLMVIRSFDDGWCLVGRVKGNPTYHLSPMSLFKFPSPDTQTRGSEGVEIGVIPAWCFMMPCKGVRAERPIRNSSLGITVEVDGVGKHRSEIMSWSNF